MSQFKKENVNKELDKELQDGQNLDFGHTDGWMLDDEVSRPNSVNSLSSDELGGSAEYVGDAYSKANIKHPSPRKTPAGKSPEFGLFGSPSPRKVSPRAAEAPTSGKYNAALFNHRSDTSSVSVFNEWGDNFIAKSKTASATEESVMPRRK